MATPRVTIDQLPEQATAEDTNYLIIQDEGVTKKMSMVTMKNVTSTPLANHLADTDDAHDASAISAAASGAGVDGTNVQSQLSQLAGLVDALPTVAEANAAYVNVGGDTMTGPLVLPAAPTVDLEAATKKYVDDSVAAASEGITQVEADALYVNVTGDTMSGALTVEGGIAAGSLPITEVGEAVVDTDALQKGQADALYMPNAPYHAWPVGSIFISVVATNPATLLGGGTWVAFGTGRMLVGLDGSDTAFDTVEETGGSKTVALAEANLPLHAHTMAHTHEHVHTHTINHDHANATAASAGAHQHTGDFIAITNPAAGASNYARREGDTTSVSFITNANEGAHTHSVDVPTFSGSSGGASDATTGGSSAANTGNVGSGTPVDTLPPYIVTYMWKRTA